MPVVWVVSLTTSRSHCGLDTEVRSTSICCHSGLEICSKIGKGLEVSSLKLLERMLASAAVVTERIRCEFGTAGGHVTPIRRNPDEEANQVPKKKEPRRSRFLMNSSEHVDLVVTKAWYSQ